MLATASRWTPSMTCQMSRLRSDMSERVIMKLALLAAGTA